MIMTLMAKWPTRRKINYDDKLDEVKQYIQYDIDGNVTGSQYIEYSPDKRCGPLASLAAAVRCRIRLWRNWTAVIPSPPK